MKHEEAQKLKDEFGLKQSEIDDANNHVGTLWGGDAE